jgi:HEPN domain
MTLRLQIDSSRRRLCSARRSFIASRLLKKRSKDSWRGTILPSARHDLEESGEACITIDATLRETIERAIPLTEYAWKFRYPGEPEEPTREEAEEGLAAARDVYAAIAALLPDEEKP